LHPDYCHCARKTPPRLLAASAHDIIAHTEGRFAKHFDKDGNPSETLLKAKQERLDNWRTLQELAGII
jgi:hypothetical protein